MDTIYYKIFSPHFLADNNRQPGCHGLKYGHPKGVKLGGHSKKITGKIVFFHLPSDPGKNHPVSYTQITSQGLIGSLIPFPHYQQLQARPSLFFPDQLSYALNDQFKPFDLKVHPHEKNHNVRFRKTMAPSNMEPTIFPVKRRKAF